MSSRVVGAQDQDNTNKESKSELAVAFDDGIRLLSRDLAAQTASIDDLVELMRKSVGIQDKSLRRATA